jgi:hypothetical protein
MRPAASYRGTSAGSYHGTPAGRITALLPVLIMALLLVRIRARLSGVPMLKLLYLAFRRCALVSSQFVRLLEAA